MLDQAVQELDKLADQIGAPGAIGLGVLALLVLLFILRRVLTLAFLALAVAFAGWGAARYYGWDVPFVLPGQLSDAARAWIATSRKTVAAASGVVVGAESARLTAQSAGGGAPAPSAAAQAAAKELAGAEIAYTAPDSMLLNLPVDLSLSIDAAEGGGAAKLATASLYGSGFDVRPLAPERQALAAEGVTSWRWEVTPRREGAHTLVLQIFAHPGGAGSDAAPVKELRSEIAVRATVASRALSLAQTTSPMVGFGGAAASLLLAGLGMLMGRRPMRRIAPW